MGVYRVLCRTELTSVELAVLLVVSVLFLMFGLELARAPWIGTPRPAIPLGETLRKSSLKWVGLMAGLLLVLVAWYVVPEYRNRNYEPMFEAIPYVLPFLPFGMALCVFYTEWRLGPAEDHAWHFGLLVLGDFDKVDWAMVRAGLFGWLVKGFFLPLNVITAVRSLDSFRGRESELLTASWPQVVHMLDHMIFALLAIAIIPGYLFTMRLIGTENKAIEQGAFGWFVTLLCYPPVNRGTSPGWFFYHAAGGDQPWTIWFGNAGTASLLAGSALVFFYLVHYWGEAICCMRSSHLTNRGIITNGPFRLCKHPVYVVKCFAWALTYLPFLSGSTPLDCLRMSFGFFAFCFVYVLRGWVEERLLSEDPDYVAYAFWMEKHSIFRLVGRWVPFFAYSWRHERWKKTRSVADLRPDDSYQGCAP